MSAASTTPPITPFLWFNDNAEEAVDFYLSVFKNSRRLSELRSSADLPRAARSSLLTVSFELNGFRFTALNGGPEHRFNPAVSFVITCADQSEIDYYWAALSLGGKESACGWLEDRFGLSWQVVPANLPQLLQHPDAMRAMLTMKKLDIAALQRAAGPSA